MGYIFCFMFIFSLSLNAVSGSDDFSNEGSLSVGVVRGVSVGISYLSFIVGSDTMRDSITPDMKDRMNLFPTLIAGYSLYKWSERPKIEWIGYGIGVTPFVVTSLAYKYFMIEQSNKEDM